MGEQSMGYEASKESMAAALTEAGGKVTEEFCGNLTMEIAGSNGVMELVLHDPSHVNTRFSPGDMVLVTVMFAKPGNVRLANDVIGLLRRLSARFDAVYIRDAVAGEDLDIGNAGAFIKAVTYAKYDFGYYYPVHREVLRSRDVFCSCRNVCPNSALLDVG